jgi:hypothetical protein
MNPLSGVLDEAWRMYRPLDGTRVVILHPPLGRFAWSAGRAYRHMTPTLTLDRILAPAEAAGWLARVSPARETDLMASTAPPRW